MTMIRLSELLQQAVLAHQEVQQLVPSIDTDHQRHLILETAKSVAPDLHFEFQGPDRFETNILDLVPFVCLAGRHEVEG